MSSILWPHSNEVQRDASDAPADGALAYHYLAGTSTPLTTYANANLTGAHDFPVAADAYGRFPAVFLATGNAYRELVTTDGGVTLFETDNIANDAPPAAAATVDATKLLATGDIQPAFATGTRSGFVRANGLSIGSSGSAATERANDDTQALFTLLWTNTTDAVCPVSGGRGATAALDWAANKSLTLPDCRSTALRGLDDMGNGAAGYLATISVITGSGIIPASIMGVNTHSLTIAQLPAVTPAGTVVAVGTVSKPTVTAGVTFSSSGTNAYTPAGTNGTSSVTGNATVPTLTTGAGGGANSFFTPTVTGTTNTISLTGGTAAAQTFTGSGVTVSATASLDSTPTFTNGASTFTGTPFGGATSHPNTSRSVLCTFYVKL